jgi:hypothetical protein
MPINLTLKTGNIAFSTHNRDGARNNAIQGNFFLNLLVIGGQKLLNVPKCEKFDVAFLL